METASPEQRRTLEVALSERRKGKNCVKDQLATTTDIDQLASMEKALSKSGPISRGTHNATTNFLDAIWEQDEHPEAPKEGKVRDQKKCKLEEERSKKSSLEGKVEVGTRVGHQKKVRDQKEKNKLRFYSPGEVLAWAKDNNPAVQDWFLRRLEEGMEDWTNYKKKGKIKEEIEEFLTNHLFEDEEFEIIRKKGRRDSSRSERSG